MNNPFNLNEEEKSRIRALHGIKVLNEQGSGSKAPKDTEAENPKSCARGYMWDEKAGECSPITSEHFERPLINTLRKLINQSGKDYSFYEIVQDSIDETVNEMFKEQQKLNDDLNERIFNRGRIPKKKLEELLQKEGWLGTNIYTAIKKMNYMDGWFNPKDGNKKIKDSINSKINKKIRYEIVESILKNPELEEELSRLEEDDKLKIIKMVGDNLTQIILKKINNSHFYDRLKRTEDKLRKIFKEKLGYPSKTLVGSLYTVKGPIVGNEKGVKLPIVEPMNFLSQLSSDLDVEEREWVNWLGNRIMHTMKDTLKKVLDNKKPLKFKVT